MNRMKSLAKGIWQSVSYLFWPQLHHRYVKSFLQFLQITLLVCSHSSPVIAHCSLLAAVPHSIEVPLWGGRVRGLMRLSF